MKGSCQLLAKEYAKVLVNRLEDWRLTMAYMDYGVPTCGTMCFSCR